MNRLEVVTDQPPNAGTPLALLDGRPLSADEVYMRNNFEIPVTAPDHIHVGLGDRRFVLTLEDLTSLPQVEVEMVLECAGNGRRLMDPVPDGTPWALGGVSPVVFKGPMLSPALGPIPEDATELVFTGTDRGDVGADQPIPYQFSLGRPVWDRSMLAISIAGSALPLAHGGPIRLVVPGHYAMKSVKWVASIESVTEPFRGHFVEKYQYLSDSVLDDDQPVASIEVRSLIATPSDGAEVPAGMTRIAGSSWSGQGRIEVVEVSSDSGASWTKAKIERQGGPYGATGWSAQLDLSPGSHELVVRATDGAGNRQPLTARWNRNGYGNNVVHRVTVRAI
ncbi:MAG: molybdopterin-dependent oxidoreductase [Acidimicrobiia bacterium]|nr:molybdopterin-dependent oxidoreductase [Acidimicrobiia bacterium]MDH3462229.1 molybdopterin-dependent oxidoreductase [Acidimicrobiia bacterium]